MQLIYISEQITGWGSLLSIMSLVLIMVLAIMAFWAAFTYFEGEFNKKTGYAIIAILASLIVLVNVDIEHRLVYHYVVTDYEQLEEKLDNYEMLSHEDGVYKLVVKE